MNNEIFKTERLSVRLFNLDNFDDFLELNQDANVMKYFEGGAKTDREAFRKFQDILETQERYGYSYWAVYNLKNEFIGQCGVLHNYDDTLNLCYAYKEKFWGKGFATEAVQGALKFVFENTNIKKIGGMASLKNLKSLNIFTKTGFKFTKKTLLGDMEILQYEVNKEDYFNIINKKGE